MVDFIDFCVSNLDFVEFQAVTGIVFSTPVVLGTGELVGTGSAYSPVTYSHFAKIRGYSIIVKEVSGLKDEIRCHLTVKGSLHKNYFGGRNSERLSFEMMCAEIAQLCTSLHVNPKSCYLRNIEIGVNFEVPVDLSCAPNEALLHSTVPFESYLRDASGKIIGRFATHRQYTVKFYSKSLQYDIDQNLLRFEHRYKKMQIPNGYGIGTLADLLESRKMREFSQVLLAAWDKTLLGEPALLANTTSLSESQRRIISDGNNRDYWIRLHHTSPREFDRKRRKYRKLLKNNCEFDKHAYLKDCIRQELDSIFEERAFLPTGERQYPKSDESFLTPWITGHSSSTIKEDKTSQTNPILSDQSDQSNPSDLSNPSLFTVATTNNQDTIALYIPHESPNDQQMERPDSQDTLMPNTPAPIRSSDSSTDEPTISDPMELLKHSEAATARPNALEYTSVDGYGGAKGGGIGSPEAAVSVSSTYSSHIDWLTARFLTTR